MATRKQVKERLAPIVMEILEEQCPWIFLEDGSSTKSSSMFQPDKLYTTKELAEQLGLSVKTMHNRMHQAKTDDGSVFKGLPSRIIGRTRVYEGRDLNEWWDEIKEKV